MSTPSFTSDASCETELHFAAMREEIQNLQRYFKDKVTDRLGDPNLGSEYQLAEAKEQLHEIEQLEKAVKLLRAAEDIVYRAKSKLFGDGQAQSIDQSGLRSLTCLVTEGLKKMSALSLSAAIREGVVRKDEHLRVTLSNDVVFETTIDPVTGRLLERGKIAEFYRLENVEPPADVYLEETSKGNWLLFSANSERHREHCRKLLEELDQAFRKPGAESQKGQSSGPRSPSRFRIQIDWSTRDPQAPIEMIEADTGAEVWLKFVDALIRREGRALLARLTDTRLSGRGPVISPNPNQDYRQRKAAEPYANHELKNAPGNFVLTHSDTNEKRRWIAELMKVVGLPPKSVAVGFPK